MASSTQCWSDEDEDENDATQIETSVFLGVPDGPVESASDLKDVAVSRIGGLPALLSRSVPFDSSQCQHCQNPMELLVQLWAPFEDSPYDRAVYVWGCARSGCQRKSGSIRAWRGLRYNEKYASKLERQLAKKREHERAQPALLEGHKSSHQNVNPFAISRKVAKAPQCGLGSDMFNSIASLDTGGTITSQGPAHDEGCTDSDDENASTSSSASEVIVALASVTLADSLWQSAPSYPPQYLSTTGEYIPPSKQAPDELTAGIDDSVEFNQEGHPWTERYENSMHTDHLFDRFNERAAHEPQQCVRYELGGIPVPFASDDLSKRLFPLSPGESASTTVTKAAFNAQNPPSRRDFNAASIPSCPHCNSRRVFEYQLMPNLINIIGRDLSAGGEDVPTTNEQRKEVVRQLLKGDPDGRGMEWGTILVFTCEKDCCIGPGNKEKQGAWTEERVLVHWDN